MTCLDGAFRIGTLGCLRLDDMGRAIMSEECVEAEVVPCELCSNAFVSCNCPDLIRCTGTVVINEAACGIISYDFTLSKPVGQCQYNFSGQIDGGLAGGCEVRILGQQPMRCQTNHPDLLGVPMWTVIFSVFCGPGGPVCEAIPVGQDDSWSAAFGFRKRGVVIDGACCPDEGAYENHFLSLHAVSGTMNVEYL